MKVLIQLHLFTISADLEIYKPDFFEVEDILLPHLYERMLIMFDSNRFITQGVKTQIPGYLQYLMWYLIENMEVEKKDHLHVFQLSEAYDNGEPMQKIIHTQEAPKYNLEHVFKANNIVSAKVYVIDDTSHCTMLLAEEY